MKECKRCFYVKELNSFGDYHYELSATYGYESRFARSWVCLECVEEFINEGGLRYANKKQRKITTKYIEE